MTLRMLEIYVISLNEAKPITEDLNPLLEYYSLKEMTFGEELLGVLKNSISQKILSREMSLSSSSSLLLEILISLITIKYDEDFYPHLDCDTLYI